MKKQVIIQSLIDKLAAKSYLEIGVQRGKNFYEIQAPFKVAIDPQFKIGWRRRISHVHDFLKNHFYEMTSDHFFENYANEMFSKKQLDIAFIDGLHTYAQSLADFNNCFRFLSPEGIILFHDCNPLTPEAALFASSPEEMQHQFPGKNGEWNGDVWKTIVYLRSRRPDLQVFVFDCDYGVGVVRKGQPDSMLSFTDREIDQMSYADLEKNRKSFLNMRSPDYLSEFLKTI